MKILLAFLLLSVHVYGQSLLLNSTGISVPAQQHNTVQLNTSVLQSILRSKPVSITTDVPMFSGTERVELYRSRITNDQTHFVMGTNNGDVSFNGNNCAIVYNGTLNTGARVIITLTETKIFGLVMEDGIAHPLMEETTAGVYYLANGTPKKFSLNCLTDEHNINKDVFEMMNNIEHGKKTNTLQGSVRLIIEIALDADNTFYYKFNDSTNAAAYLLTLFAASSAIFERDVNAEYRITYVRIWKNTIPYRSTAEDFAAYWRKNMASVNCDAAHCLSATGDGGVAARIGGICTDSGSFARSGLRLDFKSADVYSNDVFLISHEFGHVFGSAHTHSCFWRGGQIDNCGPVESGPCVFNRPLPIKGTIMSYCSQTSVGVSLEFHPMCRQMIRSFLERANCTGSRDSAVFTHALRGVITDVSGAPISGIKIRIRPVRSLFWEGTPLPLLDSVSTTTTNGLYEFKNLASGFYQVIFPESYVLYPYTPADNETTYVQKCMVMIQDSDVARTWMLDKKVGVYCTYTQSFGNPVLMILPLNTELTTMRQSNIATLKSPQLLTLTSGKYLIIPYRQGVEYTPPYQILTISSGGTGVDVSFAGKYSNINKYFGVVLERNQNVISTVYAVANKAVLVGRAANNINVNLQTDTNGVFVYASTDSPSILYSNLPNQDTINTFVESGVNSAGMTTITMLVQRPRKIPFINRYKFDSYISQFNDISASIDKAYFSGLTGDYIAFLPFKFRYGNTAYSSIRLYEYGGASFGYTEVSPNTFYYPSLNYRLPTEGMLGFANSNFRVFDTTRKMTVATTIIGTSPNRIFVAQWNFRYKGAFDSLLFVSQLRLHENDNTIEYAYGNCVGNTTTYNNAFVGIQGTDPYDIHTRTSTTSWGNTQRSTIPTTQGIVMGIGYLPSKGLVYRWRDTTSIPLGIEEDIQQQNNITIIPSPITNHAVIHFETASATAVRYEVINSLGNVVHSATLPPNATEFTIQTDAFPQGAYSFRFFNGKTVQAVPVIIVR